MSTPASTLPLPSSWPLAPSPSAGHQVWRQVQRQDLIEHHTSHIKHHTSSITHHTSRITQSHHQSPISADHPGTTASHGSSNQHLALSVSAGRQVWLQFQRQGLITHHTSRITQAHHQSLISTDRVTQAPQHRMAVQISPRPGTMRPPICSV